MHVILIYFYTIRLPLFGNWRFDREPAGPEWDRHIYKDSHTLITPEVMPVYGCSSSFRPNHMQFQSLYFDAMWLVKEYGGPQVQCSSDMHIAALPSCLSSLLSTFLFLFSAEHFSSRLSICLFCWAFFFSAEHFPSLSSILGKEECPHQRSIVLVVHRKSVVTWLRTVVFRMRPTILILRIGGANTSYCLFVPTWRQWRWNEVASYFV